MGGIRKSSFWRRALMFALAMAVALPVLAQGHIERASYWPDPKPDCSITPCAGGKVPTAGSLASALNDKAPGTTRVVCLRTSLKYLKKSIKRALANGYDLRPTDHRTLSASQADKVLKINKQLAGRCQYHQIQPAVTASHNNDRVVIMPGLYYEPTARKQPTHDARCKDLIQNNDRGDSSAVSYAYQMKCPNDQNLIAVMGRANGSGQDPQNPPLDRHGIPNLGRCIRCNVQIEGSGVSPDDVVVEADRSKPGNHEPIDPVKDVGIRFDRADGAVLRNVTVRHAGEHDVYILESDGYMFDRIKTFYAGEYGVLTFVEDHGLMQNCDAAGNGDSGLYPGAAADTGDQHRPGDGPRLNQEIRNCDSHHNALGYSGTDGNAVHIHNNNFYDNAEGFSTDVFTAEGHPGFPQDSDLIENNNFYSNNFNPYVAGSDVKPSVPVPVGTGLWIAGGNDNTVRNNHFWDNWRRGIMLFAVPDQVVCGPAGVDPTLLAGCNPTAVPPSTSYRNQFYGNVMGQAPDRTVKPNGTGDLATGRTDFWWDQFLGNTGNCWHDNTGKDGTAAGVTSTPPSPFLPSACDSSSMGTGGPQESELANCLGDITFDTHSCPWFTTPSKP